VIAALVGAELAEHVGRELPTNLRYRMPYTLVERTGGPDDGISDTATVNIDVLSSSVDVAKQRSENIRDYLTGDARSPRHPIDRAETVAGPQEIPYGDVSVRRWTTTYQITARRTAAA
jgi:hypothetical protein